MAKIAIVMGSASDKPVAERAAGVLASFGLAAEVRVISAHRTPEEAAEFARSAESAYSAVIAIAGKAAHLGGVIASYTLLPVIAVPVKTDVMGGMDSLLSIVQMPKGIPVATVAIDGAENAALLAVSILAVSDDALRGKLKEYREKLRQETTKADEEVRKR